MKTGRKESAAVLAEHSKSFALAGRLFPPGPREDAAAVYAWCRLSDVAIDLAPMGAKAQALLAVRERLLRVYADADPRLYGIAARSLLAHLRKLAAEGRVTESGGRYRGNPQERTQ